MRLTDDFVYKTICDLLALGLTSPTDTKLASLCACNKYTIRRSVKRLESAGKLIVQGGRGRRPVSYKVAK